MLWMYVRGREWLRVDIRFDNEFHEYVLIVYRGEGGRQQMERFEDAASFQSRLVALEKQLAIEQWHADGAPVLLRDGWKI